MVVGYNRILTSNLPLTCAAQLGKGSLAGPPVIA
jgi:hypothetical protein